MWDKIKNFNFFKAGVKISIRVNGTRFHYGKLLVMWSPQADNTGYLFGSTDNIFSASGFPHVLVSPTECETHEFIMPYAIPLPFINLSRYNVTNNHPPFNIGTVYVYVLNPLRVAGNNSVPTVGITIYANFVDPHLAGYTFTPVVKPTIPNTPSQPFVLDPAGGSFIVSPPTLPYSSTQLEAQMAALPIMAVEALEGVSTATMAYDAASSIYNYFKPQAPVEAQNGIVDMSDPESKKKSSSGVISGVTETIGRAAALFKPVAPNVASVVSGVSSGISTIARSLGYCNPLSQETLRRYKLALPNFPHSHGLDNAVSLSMTPDAKVSPALELLGGFPEEQSLAYLCGTPSLLATWTWKSNDVSGDIIANIPVAPNALPKFTGITGRVDMNSMTVLSHTAWPFQYWRGSLRYYLTITASAFHSGRLKISWDPIFDNTETTSAAKYLPVSHVLDIQNETDYSFSVPYLKEQCYLRNQTPANMTLDDVNGWVSISVVNQLTAPTTPIGNVYVNVYVSAGSDFQLGFCNYASIGFPDKLESQMSVKSDPSETYFSTDFIYKEIEGKSFESLVELKTFLQTIQSDYLNHLRAARHLEDVVLSRLRVLSWQDLANPECMYPKSDFPLFHAQMAVKRDPSSTMCMFPKCIVDLAPQEEKYVLLQWMEDVFKQASVALNRADIWFKLCENSLIYIQDSIDKPPPIPHDWVLTAQGNCFRNSSCRIRNTIIMDDDRTKEVKSDSLEAEYMTRETIRAMKYDPIIPAHGSIESGVVFGETPTSIKDVYKRSALTEINLANRPMVLNPWGFLPRSDNNVVSPTFVDWYRQLFRYGRGSMIYRLINTVCTERWVNSYIFMNHAALSDGKDITLSFSSTRRDTFFEIGNGAILSTNLSIQPAEAAVPWYSNLFGSVNGCNQRTKTPGYLPSATLSTTAGDSNQEIAVTLAGGDDMELCFQVGPPLRKWA